MKNKPALNGVGFDAVVSHEWLSATKCEDRQGKPYWRIDGRGPNAYCLEEIEFCAPIDIRSKLRHNNAKIIDWFTNTGEGTI